MIVALFVLLVTAQPQDLCSTVQDCRTQALEAQQRQDYEAFHDLAWAAYRKGRSNDPELMLLVARAQSLSGRPGDALVMLERLSAVAMGPAVIQTDPDFARVRALPRWDEVRQKLGIGIMGPGLAYLPNAPPASVPAPSASVPASASAKAPADKPSAKIPASASAEATADKPSASDPLSFTTVLTPSALVYDGVSKRFIVADRKARRIAVIDRTTGQVSTLVGAQGDLGEIGGITIDPRQGDLWAVSSAEGGAQQLHLIQLISGRVLRTVWLSGVRGRVVALAFVPDAGLIVADDTGRVVRVRPGGGSEPLGELEYVPRALAADAQGRLYVTAGGPRLARFTVGDSLRRTGLVDLAPDTPPDAPFTVAEGRLHFVVPVDGRYEIRSSPIK